MEEELRLKFIEELEQLYKKYHISIGGCGCCGSPWLKHDEIGFICDELTFNKDTQQYTYAI